MCREIGRRGRRQAIPADHTHSPRLQALRTRPRGRNHNRPAKRAPVAACSTALKPMRAPGTSRPPSSRKETRTLFRHGAGHSRVPHVECDHRADAFAVALREFDAAFHCGRSDAVREDRRGDHSLCAASRTPKPTRSAAAIAQECRLDKRLGRQQRRQRDQNTGRPETQRQRLRRLDRQCKIEPDAHRQHDRQPQSPAVALGQKRCAHSAHRVPKPRSLRHARRFQNESYPHGNRFARSLASPSRVARGFSRGSREYDRK